MPKYALGIAASDKQIAAHDANEMARQRNIYDALAGFGTLTQALGAAHRYAQGQANENVLAQNFLAMQQHPEGITPPLQEGQMGPQQPTPWENVLANQVRAGAQPQSVGSKLASMFSLMPQGKLTGQGAMQLESLQQGKAAAQAQIAFNQAHASNELMTGEAALAQGRAAELREANEAMRGRSQNAGDLAKLYEGLQREEGGTVDKIARATNLGSVWNTLPPDQQRMYMTLGQSPMDIPTLQGQLDNIRTRMKSYEQHPDFPLNRYTGTTPTAPRPIAAPAGGYQKKFSDLMSSGDVQPGSLADRVHTQLYQQGFDPLGQDKTMKTPGEQDYANAFQAVGGGQ